MRWFSVSENKGPKNIAVPSEYDENFTIQDRYGFKLLGE